MEYQVRSSLLCAACGRVSPVPGGDRVRVAALQVQFSGKSARAARAGALTRRPVTEARPLWLPFRGQLWGSIEDAVRLLPDSSAHAAVLLAVVVAAWTAGARPGCGCLWGLKRLAAFAAV